MPTKHRVTSIIVKPVDRPLAPLARLQSPTPTAISSHRDHRPASIPNKGAVSM